MVARNFLVPSSHGEEYNPAKYALGNPYGRPPKVAPNSPPSQAPKQGPQQQSLLDFWGNYDINKSAFGSFVNDAQKNIETFFGNAGKQAQDVLGFLNPGNSSSRPRNGNSRGNLGIGPALDKWEANGFPGRQNPTPNGPHTPPPAAEQPSAPEEGPPTMGEQPSAEEDFIQGLIRELYEGQYQQQEVDFSALDAALQARMDAINGVRNQVNTNFDQSDQAVDSMHRAFENQVRTRDADTYRQIGDTAQGNLTANRDNTINTLSAQRDAYNAKRAEMLRNLGQEQMAGAPDQNDAIFNQGIESATTRNGIDQALSENKEQNSLTYNNTVAQSVGQAGVERRSALQQQLQGLLGKLSFAEGEAKAQNQTQRAELANGVNDKGYDQWSNQQAMKQRLLDTLVDAETARFKVTNGAASDPFRYQGMGKIAEQLQATLPPEMAAQGIAALNKVFSNKNYLENLPMDESGNPLPYDKKNVLARVLREEGLPDEIATHISLLMP